MRPILTKEQYDIERAICDKADTYAHVTMAARGESCNYLTAEEAAHPDYAACDNEMRGRVEQYEILTEMPGTIVAYINGSDDRNTYSVTVWTGLAIGTAKETSRWRVNSLIGSHMRQYHARIGRNVYTGRGFGEGMSIVLRYSERLSKRV